MIALPLVRHVGQDAIIAYERNLPVHLQQFLSDVAQTASALLPRSFVLNLCADRYHFLVGLAAALTRQQVTLLPPDHTPELIAKLAREYADLYCLTDKVVNPLALDCVAYPVSRPPDGAAGNLQSMPAFPATQVAAHVFTSGSTGHPTAHEKTWGSLVTGTLAAGRYLGVDDLPGASLLGTVPPQHMYGLESTVLLALQHGLALDAGRPFFPGDIAARLAALPRPRILVTTPVHLRALLADPATLPELDLVLCATAPLAPQLAAEAEVRLKAPLYEIYGCTEAGQVAGRRTVQGPKWTLLEGIRLHADEQGTWAHGGPVETRAPLHDLIESEPGGGFLLHGRIADLVNVAGKRTSLSNLNFQLNSIPGVQDGIFVMPEEVAGPVTRLLAFVVAPGLSEAAILSALRARVDAAFLPRPLYRVAALPRNTTGKLPRAALARLVAEAAAQ